MSETNLQLFPGIFRSTVGGENPGFFLHSDGRVGIGNKAPTTKPLWSLNNADRNKLNVTGHTHIDGNLNVTGYLYGDGSTLSGITAVIGGYWDLDQSNNNISYSAGNVKIGAGTSNANLDVVGSARVSNAVTIGTTKTYVVTVQQVDNVNKYFIDGVDRPSLELHEHQTYLFDLTAPGVGHPFRLATVANGGGGQSFGSLPASDYTTGTDYTSVANHLKFTVPPGAPSTLYYYCTQHSDMGGTVSISSEAELIVSGRLESTGTRGISLGGGTTAQRPTYPPLGTMRYNSTTGYIETYADSGWNALAQGPSIASISPVNVLIADTATQLFTVLGSAFDSGLSINLVGADGTNYGVMYPTFVNSTYVTFKIGDLTSATAQVANRPYKVKVTASSGLAGTSIQTIGLSGAWTSPAAGAILTFSTITSSTQTLVGTDVVGGNNVTFEVAPGSTLPGGLSLNANTGVLSGIIGTSGENPVTFRVVDTLSQSFVERSFSIVGIVALYSFNSHIFTTVGKYGRYGPTLYELQHNSSGYGTTGTTEWVGNSSYFGVTSTGIQKWTVPHTGTYTITARGAGLFSTNEGGYGARITGTFTLIRNEIIYILVGQTPINATNSPNHGGGGGTFVVRSPYNTNASIIVIAGGGGGGHNYNNGVNLATGNASLTTSGNVGSGGSGAGAGGTNGSAGNNGSGGGSGGAGFFGAAAGSGALSFTNGGTGGQTGGFHAGFGGGGEHGNTHGGGGGGYSGGGGSKNNPWLGGGGGSYKATSFSVTSEDNNVHNGPGSVTIISSV
tara:strand:- start:326 stop:2683 length:2358 start_codon:yes stop_codon:yes gene_type:complete